MKHVVCTVIGAQKSGTSSLFRYLERHPQICASKGKETDFFLQPADKISIEAFRALFDYNPAVHRVFFEASPAYTVGDPTQRNCAKTMAEADLGMPVRAIYVLREPIARIKSAIQHGLDAGWDKPPHIRMSFDPESDTIHEWLVGTTRYASHARNYAKALGRENLLFLCFEDLAADPARASAQCVAFLGLGEQPLPAGKVVNNSARERSLEKPRWFAAVTEAPGVRHIAAVVPERVKVHVQDRFYRRKPRRNAAPNERQIRYIKDALRGEVEALRWEFGFAPAAWQDIWNRS